MTTPQSCADLVGTVLNNFDIDASTFYFGELCDGHNFGADEPGGLLHIARHASVITRHRDVERLVEPTSVILYPRPIAHEYIIRPSETADVVCARLIFRGESKSPFVQALPEVLSLSVEAGTPMAATTELMFAESELGGVGVNAGLNRLSELLVIQLVRHLLTEGDSLSGVLAGLANSELAPAIVALHAVPERRWTVESLAKEAYMSRTRFASEFHAVTGATPMAYAARLRIYLAMGKLRQGMTITDIADQLGFTSQSAFSRSFLTHANESPTAWRQRTRASAPA